MQTKYQMEMLSCPSARKSKVSSKMWRSLGQACDSQHLLGGTAPISSAQGVAGQTHQTWSVYKVASSRFQHRQGSYL